MSEGRLLKLDLQLGHRAQESYMRICFTRSHGIMAHLQILFGVEVLKNKNLKLFQRQLLNDRVVEKTACGFYQLASNQH